MGLKPIRVGQLNNYIGRVLKTDPILGNLSVIGEVSNLKFHSSGHAYFSMKDEDSKVNCFLSSSNLNTISCPLEEGMEIIATGFISVYERGGYYSLNIRSVEVNGEGQLAVQFEKLKNKLEKEGLFNIASKKELPFFPEKIAVVTSETGAAVRDIIKTIKNKNNYVDILI
ncbi:MAG: exodeoxyribonuclease VII large subunit, partial [Eubacteriales bacterium]|nr:exodeoxyribonuclease VII large subunit [Eubacteriales bacterium]